MNQTFVAPHVSNSVQPVSNIGQVIGSSIGGGLQRPSSLDKHPHTLPRQAQFTADSMTLQDKHGA